MDYEKKYKETLERARKWYNDSHITIGLKGNLKDIFPELAEPDDERIRKMLIEFFGKGAENNGSTNGISDKDILAWLEKQGEQKPADKVEPKFHEGDWILIDNPCQIESIDNNGNYIIRYCDAEETHLLSRNFCDSHFHLWTINDAKDGDVLKEDSCIFIIQKLGDNSTAAKTYFTLYDDGDFNDGTILYFDIDSTKPATKEQRDTLIKAMTDAGYIFDFEKKELKKIEQMPVDKIEPIFEVGDTMRTLQEASNGITSGLPVVVSIDNEYYRCNNETIAIKDQNNYEYPPINKKHDAWSEEDKNLLNRLIGVLDGTNKEDYHEAWEEKFLPWLKSLKKRMNNN